MGGADRTFECVGSPGTIEDAVRLTRPGGKAALVGMPPARSCLDLTALWYKEVDLVGSYAYGSSSTKASRQRASNPRPPARGRARDHGRTALPPADYREAIAAARAAGRKGYVRVVFDLRAVSHQHSALS